MKEVFNAYDEGEIPCFCKISRNLICHEEIWYIYMIYPAYVKPNYANQLQKK